MHLEFEAEWDRTIAIALAIVSAVLAGLAAAHNGRHWWIWAPIGALLPFTPAAIINIVEASPFVRDPWSPPQWPIASVACAAWSGYVARSKNRNVWLWIVLGAVFLYIPLVIVAFRSRVGDSPLERTVSGPREPHPDIPVPGWTPPTDDGTRGS